MMSVPWGIGTDSNPVAFVSHDLFPGAADKAFYLAALRGLFSGKRSAGQAGAEG